MSMTITTMSGIVTSKPPPIYITPPWLISPPHIAQILLSVRQDGKDHSASRYYPPRSMAVDLDNDRRWRKTAEHLDRRMTGPARGPRHSYPRTEQCMAVDVLGLQPRTSRRIAALRSAGHRSAIHHGSAGAA